MSDLFEAKKEALAKGLDSWVASISGCSWSCGYDEAGLYYDLVFKVPGKDPETHRLTFEAAEAILAQLTGILDNLHPFRAPDKPPLPFTIISNHTNEVGEKFSMALSNRALPGESKLPILCLERDDVSLAAGLDQGTRQWLRKALNDAEKQ